jgi:ubiquinone biosynthesis protein
MKISKIGLTYHQIGRGQAIISILFKYGFGEFVSKGGFGRHFVSKKRLAKIETHSRNERIRLAIEELGPTFIKFGQIVADRPDLVSKDLRDELKKLQDDAHPMSDEIAVNEIEKQLKKPIDEVFKSFNKTHIASASIAQAYEGVLKTGQKVALKVQRPGIEKIIKLDLSLMEFFAKKIQNNHPDFQALDIVGVVGEFGKSINKEIDFKNEAANMLRFAHNFKGDKTIYVPKVFMEHSSNKLLVEEFIDGLKVDDIEGLKKAGDDPVEIAHRGSKLMFKQIFTNGFFHADPHSGNIFIKENNVIVFIDFGMMGTLRPYHMDFLGKYVLGYIQRDATRLTEALLLLSGKRHYDRVDELEFEISDMLKHYQYLSMKEMNFGDVMNKSIDIIVDFGLSIPPTIYLLLKALITIQGVAEKLNPKIDIAKEMEPFAKDLLKSQFNPARFSKQIFSTVGDYVDLIRDLPKEISEIIYKTKEGKLKMQIEFQGLDMLLQKLDHISKRISISIVLSALIVGAAIVSQWEHMKWVGTVIFLLSGVFGFWLLIKLWRNQKFDRDK